MIDHGRIDKRSLAFSELIVQRVRENPKLVEFAKANLERWMATSSPRAQSTLQEWATVLNGDLNELLTLLTATDERATRLRQSNPFAGVLTQKERNAILLKFNAHETAPT